MISRRIGWLLLGITLTAGPAIAQQAAELSVITGATIIDGVTDIPLTGHALVIGGDTIRAVLAPEEPLPAAAERIDMDGKFIIPGLIDSHVHWLDWMGELMINHGVTSVVALENLSREQRSASHTSISSPRLFHSGDRPPFGNDDTPEEIHAVIAEWLENEPDIAHFPTHNEASARAYAIAAAEAHRLGFMIFGHAENAIESMNDGHDVVEHVWAFSQASDVEPRARRVSGRRAFDLGDIYQRRLETACQDDRRSRRQTRVSEPDAGLRMGRPEQRRGPP